MHFAIIAPPLRGHYGPLSNLAAELMRRGHRATFIHHPDAASLVEAEGAQFEPIGLGNPAVSAWTGPMSRIRGILGLGSVMEGMIRFTDMICREAPDVLERIGAGAVLADQLEPGGALVAQSRRLPFVSIATALPINREPGVPPPYVGWPYDPSAKGLKRNRGGWRVTDVLMRGIGHAIERNASNLGLPPRHRLEDCLSPLLQVSQMVAPLDFPREQLPAHFHYAGRFRPTHEAPFPLPESGGRPLAFCSLGSLQGSRVRLFGKVARACAMLDLQLLLTHGGHARPEQLAGLPGNPLIYGWVPQQAVTELAAVTICHGGMNITLDSLGAGVPAVVMPLAFEQSAIGARVRHAGAGEMLSPRSSSAAIADTIRRVMTAPSYTRCANTIRAAIGESGGADKAADLIEAALGVGAPARPATATMADAAPGDARDDSRNGSS